MRHDPDVRQAIEQPGEHEALHRHARLVGPAEGPPDFVFRLVLRRIVGERGAARRMQEYRAVQAIRGLEQREEPLVVERDPVDVREHLHANGFELDERALELGDALLRLIQRQRRDEAGKPVGVEANQVRHRVVGQRRQVERDLTVRVDRLDGRRRQRQNLPVVVAKLLEHLEAHVHVVQERDVEPALDRPLVDDDLLEPIEKGLREDVIERVDLQRHRWMLSCRSLAQPGESDRRAPRCRATRRAGPAAAGSDRIRRCRGPRCRRWSGP